MTKKNWGLLVIFFILSGVFGFLLSRNATTTSLEVNEDLFAVSDTASIERIELQQQEGQVQVLSRSRRGWLLNDSLRADPQLVSLLLSVLQNVEVKRPVARNQQEAVATALQENGTFVRVLGPKGVLEEFYAGGNEEEQVSFFMAEGAAYVMELPGYANYISGIFSLNQNNLRNRTLFSSNFINLQEINVEYPGEAEGVNIRYDGERLFVEGVQQPDSAQLLGFLGLFENLQAVGYVNAGDYPELDSLLGQPPVAEITVKDIQNPEGKELQIYAPAPGGRFRLGYLPAEQQALLLDERLAQMLLIERAQLSGQ